MLCAAAPAPPTGVTAVQVGPTSVTVSWTQSGTVTEYWIYYVSAGGEDSGSAGPMDITGTSHTLDNLQDGLIYTITVIAVGEHLPSQSTFVQICKLKITLLLYCCFGYSHSSSKQFDEHITDTDNNHNLVGSH